MQASGEDLTPKSISSVGGLIEYLCLGVWTFDLFGMETGGDRLNQVFEIHIPSLSHKLLKVCA